MKLSIVFSRLVFIESSSVTIENSIEKKAVLSFTSISIMREAMFKRVLPSSP